MVLARYLQHICQEDLCIKLLHVFCFPVCSGSDKCLVISLQVDYESEEENGEENAAENPEDEEGESEKEERAQDADEEDQNGADGDDSPHLSFMSQTKKERAQLLKSAEVRVNAVLNSHPSIQDYTFDTENELWCEVRWQYLETSVWLHLETSRIACSSCNVHLLGKLKSVLQHKCTECHFQQPSDLQSPY